jgi:serine/threonine-protein kinase
VETEDNSSTAPAGTVTRQSPQPGTTLKQDSQVVIWVSTYTPAPSPTPTTPSPTCSAPVTNPDGTQSCPPTDGGLLP